MAKRRRYSDEPFGANTNLTSPLTCASTGQPFTFSYEALRGFAYADSLQHALKVWLRDDPAAVEIGRPEHRAIGGVARLGEHRRFGDVAAGQPRELLRYLLSDAAGERGRGGDQ